MPHNEKLFDFFLIRFPSSSFVLLLLVMEDSDGDLLGLEIQRFPLISQSI